MRRRQPAAGRWWVTLVVLTLAGCTGELAGAGTPPAATPASAPAAIPTGAPVVRERVVAVPFRMVDDTAPGGSRGWTTLVGRTHMVVPDPDRPGVTGSPKIFFVRVADGRRVGTYVPTGGRILYRSFFWSGGVVLSENKDSGDQEGERITLTRWDLPAGEPRPLVASDRRPLGFLDAADMAGGVLAVPIAKGGQDDRCVHAFDLARGTGTDLFCLPAGHRIYTVRAATGGGFTIVAAAGRDLTSCRTAYRVPLAGKAERLGPATCDVLDHARVGDWDLWSRNKELVPDSVLTGQSAGRTVELGPIRMNSLVTCGRHAYWTRVSDRGYEIARWAPGGDTVEIVFRTGTYVPSGDALLANPHCNEGVLATGIATDDPRRRQVFALEPA